VSIFLDEEEQKDQKLKAGSGKETKFDLMVRSGMSPKGFKRRQDELVIKNTPACGGECNIY
jgi:hypothetical protein